MSTLDELDVTSEIHCTYVCAGVNSYGWDLQIPLFIRNCSTADGMAVTVGMYGMCICMYMNVLTCGLGEVLSFDFSATYMSTF